MAPSAILLKNLISSYINSYGLSLKKDNQKERTAHEAGPTILSGYAMDRWLYGGCNEIGHYAQRRNTQSRLSGVVTATDPWPTSASFAYTDAGTAFLRQTSELLPSGPSELWNPSQSLPLASSSPAEIGQTQFGPVNLDYEMTPNMLKCRDCGKKASFKRSYELERHNREQHACSYEECQGAHFRRPDDRRRHVESQHNRKGGHLYLCGTCDLEGYTRGYEREEKLKEHLGKVHNVFGNVRNCMLKCDCERCSDGQQWGTFFVNQTDKDRHQGVHPRVTEENGDTGSDGESSPASMVSSHGTPSDMTSSKHSLDQFGEPSAKRCKETSTILDFLPRDSPSQAQVGLDDTFDTSVLLFESPATDSALTMSGAWVEDMVQQPDFYVGEMVLIPSFGLLELWYLTQLDVYRELLDFFESTEMSPIVDKTACTITVSPKHPEARIIEAKQRLEDALQQARRRIPHSNPAKTTTLRRNGLRSRQNHQSSTPVKIFALRPEEDAEALETWDRYILPQLPELLKGVPVGDSCGAALVCQEGDCGLIAPVIRFQSSMGQDEYTRTLIEDGIRKVCLQNTRSEIPVQFSQGGIVTLVGGPSFRNDPPNDAKFPHQCRYWETPGMGSSIGMRQCFHKSATLGGYILIDDIKYMVTVEHFVYEAARCSDCGSGSDQRVQVNELSSPSPLDVEVMRERIDNKIAVLQSKIQHAPGNSKVPLANAWSIIPDEVHQELRQYMSFSKDLNPQSEQIFEFGTLDSRSERPGTNMDWAVFAVNQQREGQNIHRHPRTHTVTLQDLKNEHTNRQGSGEICEQTGVFYGGEKVYYVGTASGLQEGTISPSRSYFQDQEKWWLEWAFIPENSHLKRSSDYHGDSGAWILDDQNRVVGMIFASWNNELLFTPIQDIFNDISRRHSNATVKVAPARRRSRAELQSIVTGGAVCTVSKKKNMSRLRSDSAISVTVPTEQDLRLKTPHAMPTPTSEDDMPGRGRYLEVPSPESPRARSISPVPSLEDGWSFCSTPVSDSEPLDASTHEALVGLTERLNIAADAKRPNVPWQMVAQEDFCSREDHDVEMIESPRIYVSGVGV